MSTPAKTPDSKVPPKKAGSRKAPRAVPERSPPERGSKSATGRKIRIESPATVYIESARTASGPAEQRGPSRGERRQRSTAPGPQREAKVNEHEAIVNAIAASIAIPVERPTVRFADEYSVEATAVANPFGRFSAPWGATTDGIIPSTDQFIAVFRNPYRAIIMYYRNEAATAYSYQFYGTVQDDAYALVPPTTLPVISLPQVELFVALPLSHARPLTTFAPHGPVMFAGTPSGTSDDPRRFFWLEAGTTFNLSYGNVGTNFPEFRFDYWSQEGQAEALIVATGGATSSAVPITDSGYYAVLVRPTTGALTLSFASIDFVGAGPVCAHLPIPDLVNNYSALDGIRMISASLRYTETASPLNRQGRVAQVQMPVEIPWQNLVIEGQTGVSSANGSYFDNIEKGSYMWLKPSQASDFAWQNYIETYEGVLYDSYYPLINQSQWLAWYAVVTDVDGRDGQFTVSFGLEYLTNDTFRSKIPPNISPRCYDDALLLLRNVTQYTENPTHLDEIWRSIKSGAKTVFNLAMKYGPTVAAVAQTLGSVL